MSDSMALAAQLAERLRTLGWRLACAESCTGGLIAAACTELAGSSDWFERGVVSYSNQAKVALLAVPQALIDAHGAVSEAVARAMVEGILRSSGVDLAVSVTGIAGPSGGSAVKPVGTVWFGYAVRQRGGTLRVDAEHRHFDGNRAEVRAGSVRHALQGLLLRAQLTP
ncbi:MAG TPA: CinA family protein [Burkholderiaceae bacterium]|nr:CinA family protein [Burkholderiaceae bacterium]